MPLILAVASSNLALRLNPRMWRYFNQLPVSISKGKQRKQNCTNTAVNNQRQPPILHTRLERITLTSPIRQGSTIRKKKGTITYKNINNPHLAIWATRLRGYTHRKNAEQVSIVKIRTDQTRYGGYLNEKPRLHNQDVTKQAIQLNM